jgi:SAM-dependent methyltransferase
VSAEPPGAHRDRAAEVADMVRVNRDQGAYYGGPRRRGPAGELWAAARRRLGGLRTSLGIKAEVYDLHRAWLGDLAGRRVLDLGCHSGNALSLEMARAADSYLGIDLSAPAIATLRSRLLHISGARAQAMDFLDLAPEERFDVVYAYSVLHHFRHLATALDRVDLHLAPGGVLITYDPLETSLPIRLARRLYRPFQPDAAWEWPFDRAAVRLLLDRFETVEVRGLLGRSKWALPLSWLSPSLAASVGRRWHAGDRVAAARPGRRLYASMHLTACLRKPSQPAR